MKLASIFASFAVTGCFLLASCSSSDSDPAIPAAQNDAGSADPDGGSNPTPGNDAGSDPGMKDAAPDSSSPAGVWTGALNWSPDFASPEKKSELNIVISNFADTCTFLQQNKAKANVQAIHFELERENKAKNVEWSSAPLSALLVRASASRSPEPR